MNRFLIVILGCIGVCAMVVLAASAVLYERSQSAIQAAQSQTTFVPEGQPDTMPSPDPDDGKPRIR